MHIVKAVLISLEVEKGWPLVNDDIQLGKVYIIDLDRIETAWIKNAQTGRTKEIKVVFVTEPYLDSGWFPLENLKIVKETTN
jgi:hypothetical protein